MSRPTSTPRRILVVRNDKLGDFALALPCFAELRRALPETELVAFVPEYTAPVAALSEHIDRALLDPGANQPGGTARALAQLWRKEGFDAVIALHAPARIALAALLARIPTRVGPSSKLYQVLFNARLVQRRSRSTQPEFAYNLDLVHHYLRRIGVAQVGSEPKRPTLRFDPPHIEKRRADLCPPDLNPSETRLVLVHPGHGGSANNLSSEQYIELGRALAKAPNVHLLVSAGPSEREQAERVVAGLVDCSAELLHSTGGLSAFCETIASVDLFIGGSTGPLHVAGALDVPTAGFYMRRRTGSSLRWQTLNSDPRRLAFESPASSHERDLSQLDVPAAARAIAERFL